MRNGTEEQNLKVDSLALLLADRSRQFQHFALFAPGKIIMKNEITYLISQNLEFDHFNANYFSIGYSFSCLLKNSCSSNVLKESLKHSIFTLR